MLSHGNTLARCCTSFVNLGDPSFHGLGRGSVGPGFRRNDNVWLSLGMLVDDPKALRAAVAPGRRVMGLDVGTKTIGLALSDTRLVIASPLETIRRRRFHDDMAGLFALVEPHAVSARVVWVPPS